MAKIEFSTLIKPIPGEESCGDMPWVKFLNKNQILLCLMDIAGHGSLAQQFAEECLEVLERNFSENLSEIISLIRQFAQGKRGLVMGLALLDIDAGLIHYMGIGNIRARIIGKQAYRFVSRVGMLGVSEVQPVLEEYLLNDGDVLLMYSDGIFDHFEKKDYLEIVSDPIEKIPKEIVSKFSKNTDDSSCVALRYTND